MNPEEVARLCIDSLEYVGSDRACDAAEALKTGRLRLTHAGTETELEEARRKVATYQALREETDAENEALRDKVTDLERRLHLAKTWVDTLEAGLADIYDDINETLETMRVKRGMEDI